MPKGESRVLALMTTFMKNCGLFGSALFNNITADKQLITFSTKEVFTICLLLALKKLLILAAELNFTHELFRGGGGMVVKMGAKCISKKTPLPDIFLYRSLQPWFFPFLLYYHSDLNHMLGILIICCYFIMMVT